MFYKLVAKRTEKTKKLHKNLDFENVIYYVMGTT